MKKLLYVTADSKPENISTSKTVGREFVNRFLSNNLNYELCELDLYNEFIPEGNYKIFKSRAEVVTGSDYDALNCEDKKIADRINYLSDQFISCDTYIFAAPMWSISFPSILKKYIDCIMINNKVISITPENVTGLLNDKERKMVYIQASGGIYPKILGGNVNHGTDYFHDLFKFLGVKTFKKLLVEGTDMPDVGRDAAIKKAFEDMNDIIKKVSD